MAAVKFYSVTATFYLHVPPLLHFGELTLVVYRLALFLFTFSRQTLFLTLINIFFYSNNFQFNVCHFEDTVSLCFAYLMILCFV